MLNKNEVILYLLLNEIIQHSVGHSSNYIANQTRINQLYDELKEQLNNTKVDVFDKGMLEYQNYKPDITLALDIYSNQS